MQNHIVIENIDTTSGLDQSEFKWESMGQVCLEETPNKITTWWVNDGKIAYDPQPLWWLWVLNGYKVNNTIKQVAATGVQQWG